MNIASVLAFWINYQEVLEQERDASRRKGSLVEVAKSIALRGIVPRSLLLSRFSNCAVRNSLYYLRLADAIITTNKFVVSVPFLLLLEKVEGSRWSEVLTTAARDAYPEEGALSAVEIDDIKKALNSLRDKPWKALLDEITLKSKIEQHVKDVLTELRVSLSFNDLESCEVKYRNLYAYTEWLLELVVDLLTAAGVQAKDPLKGMIEYLKKSKEVTHSTYGENSLYYKTLHELSLVIKYLDRQYRRLNGSAIDYVYSSYVKVIDERLAGEQGRYNARSVLKSFLQATYEFLITI